MSREPILTVVMSTGGDGETDEPIAIYEDPFKADEAAEDFNIQFQPRQYEVAWQYTVDVPFIKR